MDFLYFILIGLCAGWLASQLMKGGSSGVLHNMIIGVIGAIFGGLLFRMIGLAATGLVGSLVTATVGAIVLIALLSGTQEEFLTPNFTHASNALDSVGVQPIA